MKNKTDMTKIDSTNWKSLMRCLYSDDSSTECLSLKAKNNSYQISFYAWADTGYKIVVEDFGFEENGKWNQLDPTIEQIEAMEDALAKELQRLFNIDDEKELQNSINVQNRKDEMLHRESISHNFYKSF